MRYKYDDFTQEDITLFETSFKKEMGLFSKCEQLLSPIAYYILLAAQLAIALLRSLFYWGDVFMTMMH